MKTKAEIEKNIHDMCAELTNPACNPWAVMAKLCEAKAELYDTYPQKAPEPEKECLLETLNKSEAKEALARFGAQVFDNHGNEFGLSVGQIAVICGIKDQHDGSALPGIKEAVEELINAN